MVSGIEAAASGMMAQQYNIDVISNNLANVNTPGFKQLIPVFQNLSDLNLKEKSKDDKFGSSDKNIGTLSAGSVLSSTMIDLKEGALQKTDNKLDFAISGNGFFTVETSNGNCYTKNGSFTLNDKGILVTKDGFPVLNEGGSPIKIDTANSDTSKINVGEDGSIFLDKQALGKLKIVAFNNPSDLTTIGNSLFKANVNPVNSKDSQVKQGYIEGSNSNVVETMINTISASRTYETLSKVIKTSEMTLEKAVTDVGRVRE